MKKVFKHIYVFFTEVAINWNVLDRSFESVKILNWPSLKKIHDLVRNQICLKLLFVLYFLSSVSGSSAVTLDCVIHPPHPRPPDVYLAVKQILHAFAPSCLCIFFLSVE